MTNNMTAIIIGATSGIGRGLAESLAAEGWKIGVAGRREERLEELRKAFPEGQVVTQVIDVTSEDATAALDELLAKTGTPDLIIHASGVGKQNPALDEGIEMRTIETNCMGMVRIVAHAVNYAKSCGEYTNGRKLRIAVITSLAGVKGLGQSASYSASKRMQNTYLTALSQLARMEKIPVEFTDIMPGFVATDLLDLSNNYPMLMTTDYAVKHIMKGLKKGRRIILFDWRYKLLVFAWRLIPRALWERMTFVKTSKDAN